MRAYGHGKLFVSVRRASLITEVSLTLLDRPPQTPHFRELSRLWAGSGRSGALGGKTCLESSWYSPRIRMGAVEYV